MAKKLKEEKKEDTALSFEKQDFVAQRMQEELAAMKDNEGKAIPSMHKHVLRAICQMAAFNLSPQRIANNCGIPTQRVKKVLQSISVQREIARLQTELYSVDTAKMFKRMVPEAANTVFGLMSHGDKDSTRVEAAKVILDRALGKPTQTIEQTTTLIKDVLTRLNGVTPHNDVEDAEIVPTPKPVDAIEDASLVDPGAFKDDLEDLLAEVDKPPAVGETENQ